MRGALALNDLSHDVIQAHILDPENNPLPEKMNEQFDRIMSIAKLLDNYPEESQIIKMMRAKDRTSIGQLRKDIALAKELFKTEHTFDWDFWFAWMVKDQIELIKRAKERNDLKAWNAAKKTLAEMIGEKPEAIEDPRRMMKNSFYIQVNYNGETHNIDLGKIQNLPKDVVEQILAQSFTPVEEIDANKIFES